MPLTLLPLEEPGALFGYRYTLVRRDQHVCWRGDIAPADPGKIFYRVRGVEATCDDKNWGHQSHPAARRTVWMIRKATKRSPHARALLSEQEFTFEIVTRGGVGGHFVLQGGRLNLRLGRHKCPDCSQIWRSGWDAVKTLTSTDEISMLRAYQEGKYTMLGRFTVALCFNEMMKLVRTPDAELGR